MLRVRVRVRGLVTRITDRFSVGARGDVVSVVGEGLCTEKGINGKFLPLPHAQTAAELSLLAWIGGGCPQVSSWDPVYIHNEYQGHRQTCIGKAAFAWYNQGTDATRVRVRVRVTSPCHQKCARLHESYR